MPLTAAQMTASFENSAQMGMPGATVNLVDFDKDTVEQITANLQRPAGGVPDPNPAVAANATVPTPPFALGAKSQ